LREVLPNTGRTGDLLLIGQNGRSALWLCVNDLNGFDAEWQQLLLGSPVRGEVRVDLSRPLDEPGGRPARPEP
jgi:hypothetical protein